MMLRYITLYFLLFGIGGVLALIARRRDTNRTVRRTRGLMTKYLSFIAIAFFTLSLAWMPPVVRSLVLFLFGLAALDEVARAADPRESVFSTGLLVWDTLLLYFWTSWPLFALPLSFSYLYFSPLSPDTSSLTETERRELAVMRARLLVLAGLGGITLIFHIDPGGDAWCFLWFLIATSDGYAQMIGAAIGSTPFRPALSPAKTWEGVIASTLTACVLGQLLGFALPMLDAKRRLLVSLVVAYYGLRGDLLASSSKRQLGIKDFSTTLGPHGGLLDRFDSVLGAATPYALILMILEMFS